MDRSTDDPIIASTPTPTVRVWDLPTRLFHWSLLLLVVVSLYTGNVGGLWEMDLHMLSGYAILALVLFRLAWGIFGSRHSRFVSFLRGPKAILAYARSLRGAHLPVVGHNPLGGWSVMAMLACLLLQAGTGLYAHDDIFTEGPLAKTVSKATGDFLTGIHEINATLLYVLIAVHLAAVFGYLMVKKENLIRPMITGRKASAAGIDDEGAAWTSPWLALAVLAIAGLGVWVVVAG